VIPLLTVLPILALAVQRPYQDSMRALAREAPDSVLIDAVRRRPIDARKASLWLLGHAAETDSAGLSALRAAERLAEAVAAAWNDSFPVRRVARFRSLTLSDRRATGAADSLLRAGNDASGPRGVGVAMPLWRESLRRFEALADTAGIARVLLAMGGGLADAQEYDSAAAHFARSRDLAEKIGDLGVQATALGNLGTLRAMRGDLDGAVEWYARAKPIRERIGDLGGLAGDQGNLGVVARKRGNLVEARRAYEAALAANRTVGDSDALASNLLNLANLTAAWEGGDYEVAAGLYREALAIRRAIGNKLGAALVEYNFALLTIDRGDYPTAVTLLTDAVAIVRSVGAVGGSTFEPALLLARARAEMGDLRGARADLDGAEAFANRRSGGERGASLAWIALGRAELAIAFNRLAEAEQQFTRAQRLVSGASNAAVRQIVWLQAQHGLVDVQLRSQNYRRAQVALEELVGQLAPADGGGRAIVRVRAGQVAWRLGDTATARRTLTQAIDTLRNWGGVVDEVRALTALGELERQAGRTGVAESLYRAGLNRLGAQTAPAVAWPLHAALAGVLRSRHELDEAAKELRTAVGQIERVSGGLQLEEQRSEFRADKWHAYVDLAMVERARGRTEAAFEASEQLRARQMLDLLARGRVTAGQNTERLASREQDLRRRLSELARQTDSRGSATPGLRGGEGSGAAAASATGSANDPLTNAQEEYAQLLVEMREANPSYAALVQGDVAPATAVMAALGPDDALLEYLVGDSSSVVFVVTRDSVTAVDLPLSHTTLTALVDFARSTLVSPAERAGSPDWRPPLRRLYDHLIAPVESHGLLVGKRRLVIAPHAELHYLPFGALVRRGSREQFLVERYVIEYVPSASVWMLLRDRRAPARRGVLALAPRPSELPGSQAEIAAIQRSYKDDALTLVGRAATESVFRALAPERDIVHLASHGVLNKRNPLFSYIQLAAGGGDDGRLEVHEAFGLNLGSRLVVLSGCQTGVGAGSTADVPPGDDWVGLVNAFLFAGAQNVLGTLWPVQDVSTARLMSQFYKRLREGRSEAEALAVAQRAALREPASSHPFYWAGFTLVRGN